MANLCKCTFKSTRRSSVLQIFPRHTVILGDSGHLPKLLFYINEAGALRQHTYYGAPGRHP